MYTQPNDGHYPDVKAIASGYFNPKDPTRCLVCGKDLRVAKSVETTCGRSCFRRMCAIQRDVSEVEVDQWIFERERS